MAQETNGDATRGIKKEKTDELQPASGQNYLLVIGIDEYAKCPKLYNAVKDAKDIVALLQSNYQFDPGHTITLFNAEATQQNIYRVLDDLSTRVTHQDNLLIYFSGHGEYKKNIDEGFWIPVDGDLGNIGSFLPFEIFSKYLKAIGSFHTVVIADSCYAGSMFTDRNLPGVSRSLQRLFGIPSRWLLTAGRNEVVSDGKPGDNSPFADSLLFHLKNNPGQALRISELCQLVIADVSSNVAQVPRGEPIHGVGHRGGEFLFLPKGAAFRADVDSAAVQEAFGSRGAAGDTGPAATPAAPPAAAVIREPDTFESVGMLKESFRAHLMAGDVEAVFKLFNRVLDSGASLKNELILQQAQYNSLQRDLRMGVITNEASQLTTNRIRNALLYYVDRLDAGDLKAGTIGPPAVPATRGAAPNHLEREGLEKEAAVLQRKINFFREEMARLADVNQKFSLQEQIREAEERLEEIRKKIG